jgi:micrococcal nuclease
VRPPFSATTVAPLAGLLLAVVSLAACGGGSDPSAAGGQPVSSPVADAGLQPKGDTVSGIVVDRVVDGDTIKVSLDGEYVSVRLIGMNTPETVKPDSPVECFGPESSDFAKATLTGERVTLEFDGSQGMTDQYDRTLAYVWREMPDGSLRLFNLESIAGGYAFERQYGSTPYAWKDEFAQAQRSAKDADSGLWGACDYS